MVGTVDCHIQFMLLSAMLFHDKQRLPCAYDAFFIRHSLPVNLDASVKLCCKYGLPAFPVSGTYN